MLIKINKMLKLIEKNENDKRKIFGSIEVKWKNIRKKN